MNGEEVNGEEKWATVSRGRRERESQGGGI